MMRTWDVRVIKSNRVVELGQVQESTEEYARCAALYKYGCCVDEAATLPSESLNYRICESDEFTVAEK